MSDILYLLTALDEAQCIIHSEEQAYEIDMNPLRVTHACCAYYEGQLSNVIKEYNYLEL